MMTNSANDTDDDEMSPDKATNMNTHQSSNDNETDGGEQFGQRQQTNALIPTDAIGHTQSVNEAAIENAEAENHQQLTLSRMQSVNGSFEEIGEETNECEDIGVADVPSTVDLMRFGQQNPAQFDNPSAKKTKSYAEAVRDELTDGGNSDEPMMEWEGQQNQRENSTHGDSTLSDNVHCLQSVAQPVTEFGIDFVSAKQTGDDFGVRNVQQQNQCRRNDESDIGLLEKKKCFASLEIHRMDNPNERCVVKKYEFFLVTDNEQHQMNSAAFATSERCNPTVGQMTQKILSEHFETPIDKLIAQFDMQMQIRDHYFDPVVQFVDMEKNWSTESVKDRALYKVLLHSKMDARSGRGYEDVSARQMDNRGPRQHNEQIDRFLLSEVKAPLANLYDVSTDNFVTSNDHEFVNRMAKNKNLTIQDGSNSREKIIEFESFDDLKERTKMLGLDQKLSVISQLAHFDNVSPLGQFLLKAAAQTERGNSFGFIKIVPKTTFSLKLGHPKVRDIILQQLPVNNATHFVMSACYGSIVAAIFTFNEHSAIDKTDISNAKRIARKFLDGPRLNHSDKSFIHNLNKSISCSVFVDPSIGNCLTDLDFFKGLNYFAVKCSTAKDTKHPTPIIFSLVPLSFISDNARLNPISVHRIDEHQFGWFCGHVQTVNDYGWQLRKVRQSLNECCAMLTNDQFDNAQNFFEQSEKGREIFYDSLKDFIVDLRMCKAERQKEVMVQREAENYVHNCQCVIGHYEHLVNEKKEMVNELKQKGVTYIGRSTRQQLDSHFALDDSNSSVFHFVLLRNSSVPPVQTQHTSFLLCLGKLYELVRRGKCTFVDLDVLRDGEANADEGLPEEIRSLDGYPNFGMRLIKMRGNKLLSKDYMAEEKWKLQFPIARIENIRRTEVGAVPEADSKDIQACSLPCPFCEGYGGKCSNIDNLWECDDCCEALTFVKIEKAQITHLFCACGKTPVDGFSFRCSDVEKHGTEFKHFGSKASLDKELDRLNNKGMLTLLLLGETGVGKSTLINALIAYLKHATLQEALEANEIDWVIPARFCTGRYDNKGNRKRIEVRLGEESKEERLEAGESQTKWPNAYVIPSKDGHKVRIIDAPGIGDTNGINEDKINFDKTLNFISTLPELHAVCILLRPNSPRSTLAIKYCIGELLTYLHKNAANNIVFVFTNARGSNYDMGKTDEVLEKLLTPIERAHNVSIPLHRDRIYCVDNEAYEALCLIKKANIEYDQAEMDNFSRSWAHAEKEFQRLFQHVSNLEPHRTWETVSVNEARRTIIDLSEPLALITEKIQTNLDLIKKYEEVIKLGEEQVKNAPILETIEFVQLTYPRTVCAAPCCTSMQRTLTGDVKLYMKLCHEHCHLKRITAEVFPNEGLKFCAVMGGTNTCKKCGCDWSVHMHYHYEQRQKTFTIEEIEQKLTSVQREGLSTSESVQKQMLEERGIIYKKAAQFCAFLKKWALKSYNDSMEAYINMSIKHAEKVVTECKGAADEKLHENKLEGLRESLRLYREQKELIDNATADDSNGPNVITAEDVKKFFDELCELPFFGADIRQMFETKQKSRHEHQKEYSEKKTSVGVKLRPTKSGKVVQPEQCLNEEQRKLFKEYEKKQKEMEQLEQEMENKNMLQCPTGTSATHNQPSTSSSSSSFLQKIPGFIVNHLFGSSSSQNVPSSSYGTLSRNTCNLSSTNFSLGGLEDDRGVMQKNKQMGNYRGPK
ncbi:hypothetical protein niasHT_025446 [Heterodera trifolii]|uniref:DUF8206 domain-containing protein n=1 Tax=Heterodera trifolii TaxID=157864 RepID=A0ABD2JXM9_9BILA